MLAQGHFVPGVPPRRWFEKCTSEVGANDCCSGRSLSGGKRGKCSSSLGNEASLSELGGKSDRESESELLAGLPTTAVSVLSLMVPIFL